MSDSLRTYVQAVAVLSVLLLLSLVLSDIGPAFGSQKGSAKESRPFAAHVLVYHSVRPLYPEMSEEVRAYTVTPDAFEAQLAYLKGNGYHVIALTDIASSSIDMPEHPVAITFDDGWENQYVYAFPLLQKYGMTATFFVFPNALGHKNWMTWDQVRELSRAGMDIGSHSKSHPYLHLMTDEEELREEILGSKEEIEAQTGTEVSAFAYPFGIPTERLGNLVRGYGYSLARTFPGGCYYSGGDTYSVPGQFVTEDITRFKELLHD